EDGVGDVEVGGPVHIDMAVAGEVLHHRHPRLLGDAADEAFAAARDGQVDELVEPQQVSDGGAVGRRHQLHRVGRQLGGAQPILKNAVQGGVGVERFLTAAEDDGVAGLDAQAHRVHGDVRPRLVNEEDDAERHADLVDVQAVGTDVAVQYAADRIGQGGDLAQPVAGGLEPGRCEAK